MGNAPTKAELELENRDLRDKLNRFEDSEYQPILRTDKIFLEERTKRFERENARLQRDLNQAVADKATITEAFDKRGVELEDYKERVEIAIGSLAESSHRLDEVHQKNTSLVYDNKCLREELSSLQGAIIEPKDKECVMTEQSPEAKAYEDIHTKRMAAEIEAIELDNKKKQAELNGYEDYPHSVYESLSRKVENTIQSLKTRTLIIWGAIVAFGVNEVIQWLTR